MSENTDPNVKIYAIDLWDNRFILKEQADHYHVTSNKPGAKLVAKMLHENDLYQTFMANLYEHHNKLTPIRMDTVEGVHWLKAQGVVPDMIYVDADHHYEAAKKDITACCKCFPNAVLCGDDYGNYEDVKNAVNECALEFNKELHVDANHCWIYMDMKTNIYGLNVHLREKPKVKFGDLLSKFKKKDKIKKEIVAPKSASRTEAAAENVKPVEKKSEKDTILKEDPSEKNAAEHPNLEDIEPPNKKTKKNSDE